jgi:DNA-binding transcriptional regulator YiaG
MPKEPVSAPSGYDIRQARKAAGMTQAQLAYVLGVTPSTVYLWEKGPKAPKSQAHRRRLWAFIGKEVSDAGVGKKA